MNYYNYFTEIEETFIRRRGKNLLLSPLDWALIETWQEREIPLHIVLRGIEKVFDVAAANPRKRSIKSIAYCREEIEAQFAEHLDRQVGKADGANETAAANDYFSKESVAEHLANVIAALANPKNANLREDFARAADRLAELNANLTDDYEQVSKISLTDIEKFLDRSLLTNTDKAHLTELETQTAKSMSAYKSKMEKEVYEQTFNLMLLKRLRDEAEIPRLSLFYL